MENEQKKEIVLFPLKIGHDSVKLLVHFVFPLKCEACERTNLIEKNLELPFWEATLDYVCGYGLEALEEYAEKQITCKCGCTHTIHKPLVGRLCVHFVDVSPVLHIDISLSKEGAKSFSFRQISNTGFTELSPILTDVDLFGVLGRVFNVGAVWNRVMAETVKVQKLCRLKVAPGYTIIGVPDNNEELIKVKAEIDSLSKDTIEVIPLTELFIWKHLQNEGTFIDWAPAFAPLIRNGKLGAFVMLDWSLIDDYVVDTSERLNVTATKLSEGTYRVSDNEFVKLIKTSDLLLSATISGYTLGEAVHVAVIKAKLQIGDMQKYYGLLQASLSGLQLTHLRDRLNANVIAIRKEDLDYGIWNLDFLQRRYPDREAVSYWATQELPHIPNLGIKHCPICKMERVLVRRLKPVRWSRGRQDLLIERQLGESIVVYAFDCLAHTIYVTQDLISDFGLGLEDIKAQANKDIENDTYHVVAGRKLIKGKISAIWAWGTNIASIALDGRLVGGLLKFMEVDWKGILHIDVVDTNALVIFQDSSQIEGIRGARLELANIIRDPPGERGMPLNLQIDLTVDEPVGRFFRIEIR